MKRKLVLMIALTLGLLSGNSFGQQEEKMENPIWPQTEAGHLEKGFRNPPDSARPWVFTNLGYPVGNTKKEDITKDLEALRRQGIGGLLFADGGPDQLGPSWRENFRYLVQEADRLGFDFNANVANGFGTGGPWATPEMAAKKLVYTEMQVDGPEKAKVVLPIPELIGGYYHLVCAVRDSAA